MLTIPDHLFLILCKKKRVLNQVLTSVIKKQSYRQEAHHVLTEVIDFTLKPLKLHFKRVYCTHL